MTEAATPERAPELSPVASASLARLMRMRDELVASRTNGRYVDAAGLEWNRLPSEWRMTLLLVAGVGVDLEDLNRLASREWREMPEPERDAVRSTVRQCKKHVGALTAMAAKV